jgi:hypothetical protein
MRGAPISDVMRPKLPALNVVFGFPQLMLFVRLKVSRRSSSDCEPIAISRGQRHVDRPESRSVNAVSFVVSERAGRRLRERRGIQVVVQRFRAVRDRRAPD